MAGATGQGSNWQGEDHRSSHGGGQQGGAGQNQWSQAKNQNLTKNNNTDSGGGGNGYKKPRGVIDAVSEIQQYYALEKQVEDELPAEYFTIKQSLDFFNIGLKSAFTEGIIFIVLIPFVMALYPSYKLYFYGLSLSTNEQISMYALTYGHIGAMTMFLAAMSRYYSGNLTKNAIVSLLSGRSSALILKAFLAFGLFKFMYVFSMTNPQQLYKIAESSVFVFKTLLNGYNITPMQIYSYYYLSAAPALNKVAYSVMYSMLFMAILPFITLVYRGYSRELDAKNAKTVYENY
jgi:hypothetical protein